MMNARVVALFVIFACARSHFFASGVNFVISSRSPGAIVARSSEADETYINVRMHAIENLLIAAQVYLFGR
jgi:hypothetical protein